MDCSHTVSTHEYHEETIGLLACLTRKSVGDVNFSALFDEAKEFADPKE